MSATAVLTSSGQVRGLWKTSSKVERIKEWGKVECVQNSDI